jgi:hypothetical protein
MKRLADDRPTDCAVLSRARLLQETSEVAGASWAREYLEEIQKSGRAIEGGWPGTLREARARVMQYLPRELSARGLSPLSSGEIADASAVVSAAAKRCWRPLAKQRST